MKLQLTSPHGRGEAKAKGWPSTQYASHRIASSCLSLLPAAEGDARLGRND